ncbi:MAG: cupin domain-containing protein [Psychrosphaera sp.]|nr:cupin domain-containing protein [Psychrosphaera sp.]
MTAVITKDQIMQSLALEPHPLEGGYFKRTYESDINIGETTLDNNRGNRKLMTTIVYMLTDDSPICYMHCNKSDIVHFYQGGGATKYTMVSPDGQLSEKILGPDVANGHCLQLVVTAGNWKTSTLLDGTYGLIGEAVAPGFEYEDNVLATKDKIKALFPDLVERLGQNIKR